MLKVLLYPFKMIWYSIFDNDCHEIVSKKGWRYLNEKDDKR